MPKKRTNRSGPQDPFAQREARKYERPIPSREYILQHLQQRGAPANHKELCSELKLKSAAEQDGLQRRLGAMERAGQVLKNRRDNYCLSAKLALVRGRIMGHADGYGFVIPADGSDDVYLNHQQMQQVMHGDIVLVQPQPFARRRGREGIIVEILERNTQEVVGHLREKKGVYYVDADNPRLTHQVLIPNKAKGKAKINQVVLAKIISHPTGREQPIGEITKILGEAHDPSVVTEIAIHSHNIPYQWPKAVTTELKKLPHKVLDHECEDRVDIRELPLVTIDGEDAQDFDDAVYCTPRKQGGWRLLVAIADVSHYIQPGSALDEEANVRGNSVYFPNRVVPMLPEKLSNKLCSLQPNVDRLCMVCEMTVGADGELQRSKFYPAVMHSHARLTYNEVAAILKGDKALKKYYSNVVPDLQELYRLFKILHRARKHRGALEFDTTETQILFGETQKIESIVPVLRNDAHKLIEECMLLANIATARFLLRHKIPTLYRVHEGPTASKLADVREFLMEVGLKLPGKSKPDTKDYSDLLSTLKKRPDAHLIQTILLRSLSQARYQPDNLGHFGLAYSAYAHFTSPIRRYPDLLVHRAIRHVLAEQPIKSFEYSAEQLQGLGEHCSVTERRADEATRDIVDWLKCDYMLQHVGDSFDGIIASVTSFGLFIELRDIYVEGLVHITQLSNDYYQFDAIHHRLRGERSGKVYRLGDPLRVQVARVDLDTKKIDFVLADD